MKKTEISTKNAPAAIGPYSQAIAVGDMLYTSGQIPLDPNTSEIVSGGITEQAHRALKNIGEVLAASGLDYSDVVKTTVFVTDLGDFAAVNAVYGEYFEKPYPARSCVQVAALPKNAKIEIEVIARLR
ncbi:MAG: RidA family protein [Clostridiales bacterium]|nr:RidA family protein [Clostridiales bacterium]